MEENTSEEVDVKHLTGILGSVGKAIAAMPEGRRVIDRIRVASSREDLVFLLRSAEMGVAPPAQKLVLDAANDERQWEDVRSTLLRSAELQLTERFSSNA